MMKNGLELNIENQETGEKEDLNPPFQCALQYDLCDRDGNAIENGCGTGIINLEKLIIQPDIQDSFEISLRDIVYIAAGDYRIQMDIGSYDKLVISQLGYCYEDFLDRLYKLRTDEILKYMLVEDRRIFETSGEFLYKDENHKSGESGECFLYLYETALVVVTGFTNPVRIPYSIIASVKDENYTIELRTDIGELYRFQRLGDQFEIFRNTFIRLINDLSKRTQLLLKEIMPELSPGMVRSLAALMKDGKAASKKTLDAVSRNIWKKFEENLNRCGMGESYEYLKSKAPSDNICIGIKRELLGALKGEYIWFMIPIYSFGANEAGNIIAIEAVNGNEGGKATYFFRIAGREQYKKYTSLIELEVEVEKILKLINYCLLDINFRREPIYISEEQIEKTENTKYRYAVEKIHSLQILRKHFVGRVMHSSMEQWKRDVENLIAFNANSSDDNEKWKR